MQFSEFIAITVQKLQSAGIDNPQLDARLLICHALKCDRADLLSQSERILSAQETAAIDDLIARRLQREPVARILGQREFWGLSFGLNEATLEPRPDSETVVEAILKTLKRRDAHTPLRPPLRGERGNTNSSYNTTEGGVRWDALTPTSPHLLSPLPKVQDLPSPPARAGGEGHSYRILDLGTGTGCLLLSLLHEIPDATGIGVDIMPRAVEQAQKNAAALGLRNRATILCGNWFDPLSFLPPESRTPNPPVFDIIVGNPPYIPASHIPALMPEVRDYDPALALNGGEDGLTAYRFLIPQLKNFLNPNGIAAFEVGINQAQQVADLFRESGFKNIEMHKDLGGVERCVSVSSTS